MQKKDDPQSTPPYDPKMHHPTIWSPAYDHLNPILLGRNFQLWGCAGDSLAALVVAERTANLNKSKRQKEKKNRGKRDHDEYAKIIICKLDPETLKQWSCRPSHMLPTSCTGPPCSAKYAIVSYSILSYQLPCAAPVFQYLPVWCLQIPIHTHLNINLSS